MIDEFGTIDEVFESSYLEYVADLAIKYLPDVDEEGTYSSVEVAQVFRRRYNEQKIKNNFTYDNFIKEVYIQKVIEKMGLDRDKFWFALLFIYDYTYNLCEEGLLIEDSPMDQIQNLLNAYEKYLETIESLNEFKGKITISFGSKNKIVVDNPLAIAGICNEIDKLNKRIIPSTQFGFRKINMKIIQDTDEGVFCYLFTKAMKCFLPEKNFRKKGNEETLSKYMLISNLIYFTKISRNKNLKSDEEIVKNYIKYYNKHKPKIPFNKAYFNYWQGL